MRFALSNNNIKNESFKGIGQDCLKIIHKPLGRLDQTGYIAMHSKRLGRSPVIVTWSAKMYGASLPINSVATL